MIPPMVQPPIDPNLRLASIESLLDKRFHVPEYQRGYRWTARQVRELLNDLLEFVLSEPGKREFYCLQPVVVGTCQR